MINDWLEKMQKALWPRTCLLCSDPAGVNPHFCSGCAAALPWLGPACRRCASPLPHVAASCGNCQRENFAFTHVHAAFRYRAPVDALIQRLKYARDLPLARVLGETWLEHPADRRLPDVIVPVPLHTSRLRERGFNQSLELARPLARHLDIRLAPDALARVRATAPQAGLAPAQRARNVRDAFQARYALSGRRVALLDDVMTTGHTADAAACAALEAGAQSVAVWVLARA